MSDIDSIMAAASPNRPDPDRAPADLARVNAKPVVTFDATKGGFDFNDIEGAIRLAEMYVLGGMVPDGTIKDCPNRVAALARVVAIIEAGKSLGIQARAALQNISVVRGRIMVWGDVTVALCQRHHAWAGIEFEYVGELEKGTRAAIVTVHRKGCPSVTHAFSQADAKRAGLGGNVWASYTDRMLFQRARSWALRDQFADALNGMTIGDEYETTETAAVVSADDAMRLMQADAKVLEDGR
jgi:hypothetical protein